MSEEIFGRKRIYVNRNFAYGDEYQLYLFVEQQTPSGKLVSYAESMTLRNAEDGIRSEPLMHLRPDEAQMFMDELWKAGVRPKSGEGSVGQLAATEKHLNDMRKLVEKSTGAILP